MSRRGARILSGAALVLTLAAACGGGPPTPSEVDTRNDTCAHCRMTVSDPNLAAQIAAPGEEPRFFDDIGCLKEYLAGGATSPRGAVACVADHRTGEWVRADRALYTRVPELATPMDSHLMAHADLASRDRDPGAQGGASAPASEVFGRPLPGESGSGS